MKGTAYLLQAALVVAWWAGLCISDRFFAAFQFSGISSAAFWAFLLPDLLLVAGLSFVSAYSRLQSAPWVLLGAFGYAALYCCNVTLLTGSGYLPTLLMLAGLAYNLFLCLADRTFHTTTTTRTPVLAFKTVVQIICFWALLLAIVPAVILHSFQSLLVPDLNISTMCCITAFAGFSGLGLASAWSMVWHGRGTPLPTDQASCLVTGGPYAIVRNPMAVAGIGQGLCLAGVFESIPLLAYSLLGAIAWHLVVRPLEERDLRDRFGQAYADYCQRVCCWVPRAFFRRRP
ncbi:MAG: methyltransferase family protein [Planctomycetota bacterium]